MAELVVFTPASTIGTHYRKCKQVLMATTTQSSYSIGKPLNLTYHNSGRTIPQFLTQLQLGTTPSDRYKCNRRVKWRSISPPPYCLNLPWKLRPFLSLSSLIRDYLSQLVSCSNEFYPTGIPMRTRNFIP